MKTIRLNDSQRARYRQNRFALIDSETGEFARYATRQEAINHYEYSKRKQTVRVKENGRVLNFKPDRERLKEELIAEYGETVRCVMPNNLQFMIARVHTPMIDPEQKKEAPHPSRCQCSEWADRPDGKHHPHCSFNRLAPLEHQSELPDILLEQGSSQQADRPDPDRLKAVDDMISRLTPKEREVLEERFKSIYNDIVEEGNAVCRGDHPEFSAGDTEPPDELPAEAEVVTEEVPVSPSDCKCSKWRKPERADPSHHHPACTNNVLWRSYIVGQKPMFLFTMKGNLMRPATFEEIEESKKRLQDMGSPTIVIGEEEFMVLDEQP